MRTGLVALAFLAFSTIAVADISNPEVLERKPVPYPAEAKRLAHEGEVELRVWVNADGTAGEVVLLRSSGDEHLDRAAAAGVKDWKYKPSRRDSGEAIGNTILVQVQFQLTDQDMQSAPPQAQLMRYATIWADFTIYQFQNEAIYEQCEAAGISSDSARAGVARHDAGLDQKIAALVARMKRLYGPAGTNVDPDRHMDQFRTEQRARAKQIFEKKFDGWSAAERVNRCRETLHNMELGLGSYRDRPEYEILMNL